MTDDDRLLKLVDEKSVVATRIGRYVGFANGRALVDIGDQRVPAQWATPWVPEVNEPVWVDSVDGELRLIGPTKPKPGVGVVLTITGNRAVIRTDFGDYPMLVAPTNPMPTSGETVGISWSSTPWCTLLVDTPDAPPPPPDPGGAESQIRSAEFKALDAGSTDRGSPRWWSSQPQAGNSTYGAWMYGSTIKDTIPSSAQFISLEIYVAYQQRQGNAPRWVLHNLRQKTAVPNVSAYVEWAPSAGWQTPPDAQGWFNALKAGGAWEGVGLNQGGYNIFSSLVEDGFSGALRIKWKV